MGANETWDECIEPQGATPISPAMTNVKMAIRGEEAIFDYTCRDVAWGDSWTDKSREQPL